jgi:hypothetical protein
MASPKDAAMPWMSRVTISTSTDGAAMHTRAVAANTTAGQQGGPASAPVADRAGDQLPEPEAEEEGRDGECHRGLRRAESLGRRRHRRQEEVGGERPQAPQAAEDQDDDGAAARREDVEG